MPVWVLFSRANAVGGGRGKRPGSSPGNAHANFTLAGIALSVTDDALASDSGNGVEALWAGLLSESLLRSPFLIGHVRRFEQLRPGIVKRVPAVPLQPASLRIGQVKHAMSFTANHFNP